MLRLGKSLTKNANGNISPHATAKQIDTHAAAPQRGFTTKPGVAVTTAHPRKHGTKPIEPQRGSTSQMRFLGSGINHCGTPLGFGAISISLPGVRRNAATPGFVVKPVPGLIARFPSQKILHGVAQRGGTLSVQIPPLSGLPDFTKHSPWALPQAFTLRGVGASRSVGSPEHGRRDPAC